MDNIFICSICSLLVQFTVFLTGWMEGENFLSWFNKMFIPAVKPLLQSGPVVLFVDGHHSHMGVDLIMSAREAGIQILCLPPHTTHILKSLDVGVYEPVHGEKFYVSVELKLVQLKFRRKIYQV